VETDSHAFITCKKHRVFSHVNSDRQLEQLIFFPKLFFYLATDVFFSFFQHQPHFHEMAGVSV